MHQKEVLIVMKWLARFAVTAALTAYLGSWQLDIVAPGCGLGLSLNMSEPDSFEALRDTRAKLDPEPRP